MLTILLLLVVDLVEMLWLAAVAVEVCLMMLIIVSYLEQIIQSV